MLRWSRLIYLMIGLLAMPPLAFAEAPLTSPSEQITAITNQTVNRITFIKRHPNTEAKSFQLVRRQAIDAITDTVNDYLWTAEENQVSLSPKQRAVVLYQAQEAVNTIELLYREASGKSFPSSLSDTATLPALPPLTTLYAKTHRPFLPSSPLSRRTLYQYPEQVSPFRDFWSALGLTVAGILGSQSLFAKPATLNATLYNPDDQTTYTLDIEGRYGKEQAIPISFSNNWRSDIAPGDYQIRYHGDSYNLTIRPNETWCLAIPQPPVRCY